MRIRSLGLAVVAALVLAACSDDDDNGGARLRAVHLSPDAPLVDIYVDDALVAEDVAYLDETGYLALPAGANNVVVTVAGDPTAVVIDATPTLSEDTDYTVLAANFVEELEPIVLLDDNSAPSSGSIQVRIVHGSPSTGLVDVYVTAPGVPLDEATATLTDVAFGQASNYLEVPAGTYQIRVTPANTLNVALDSGPVTFSAGQIRTVIAADADGGGAPLQALVLADRN
jgi:hypothetical protein